MAKKIKHIKSGYFIGPTIKRRGGSPYRSWKTNLRKRGKVYESFQNSQIESWYARYLDRDGNECVFNWNDFEIIEC